MTSAKRISNLQYPKGSVITASFRNRATTEFEFLDNRPLIVVSNQMQMFDTLMVIPCTSRNRPGIEVSLFNTYTGEYIGHHEATIASPNSIYTINVSQIKKFHGVIDPYTMEAIDKAIAFHLGLTKEVPPYMQEIYEDLLKPRYNIGTDENTQLSDPHALGSANEVTRSHAKKAKQVSLDIGSPYKAENPPMCAVNITADSNDSEQKDIPNTKEKEKKVEVIDPRYNRIALKLKDEDKIQFILKLAITGNYATNSGSQIFIKSTERNKVRAAIEDSDGLTSGKFISSLTKKICKRESNFRFLSEYEKVCAVMYGNDKILEISGHAFTNLAINVIRKYNLDFSSGRSWKNLNNFVMLKCISETCCKK